jgi:hypothetical protein
VVTSHDIAWFSFAILGAFILLFGTFWFSWWLHNLQPSPSPYSGLPLRRASDLSYYNAERTLRYIYDRQDYDNRLFELRTASFCRETGRIFPNSITWYDVIRVDWTFLNKRYPGDYVSWGSLTADQQMELRERHESLQGFQTESSSPIASPRAIEPQYAMLKPGPLYVELNSQVLVGWKCVPDTDLEVLVVQKPKPIPKYTPRELKL